MKTCLSLIFVLFYLSLVNAATLYDLTAKELYSEYAKNEIAAEERYKGKEIFVSGIIKDISKNIAGQATVTLDAGTLQFVTCRFLKEAEIYLTKLKKGQNVRFICKVEHKKLTNIFLSDCTLR